MLGNILGIKTEENITNFLVGTTEIATYAPFDINHSGKKVNMQNFNYPGCLHVNLSFFTRMFPKRLPGSDSQMVNIAVSSFIYVDKNQVCLIQYCAPGKRSSEHYHTLDEYIGCIAGSVKIRLSPADDHDDAKYAVLKKGDILRIPPKTRHLLSSEEGSITVPIKHTVKGNKDHFYD